MSRAFHDAAIAAIPALRGKTAVILNALPMPKPRPTELPFARPVLLCLGRLVWDKGFDLAIRAFALLRDRGIVAKLVVAGDGSERSNLEALAGDLRVADGIEFIGWVAPDRVADLINTATLMLMPSRWPEPFGLVALQAAQMGRPTIAAAVGGLPEIVEHGRTGLLVAADSEHGLADAVQELLANPRWARRLGDHARQRAREKFDFAAFVDDYERVYAETRAAALRRRHDGDRGALNA